MTPVALSLEELIPSNIGKSHMYAILIRTALVISTLVVGLSIPFFGEFLMVEQLLSSECMLFYSVKSFNIDSCSLVHLSEQFYFDALRFSFLFDRSGDGTNWIFTYNASSKCFCSQLFL